MRDFDAVITRDGTVYHLAWANHLQTVAHFGIPENITVYTPNKKLRRKEVLSAVEWWKAVRVIQEGEGVFA